MRYYIADCHFFHEQLNDQMDHRGFKDADEMNAYMIQKWNKKVRKNDAVVVLGDFSYGTPEQNAELFPQQKIIHLALITTLALPWVKLSPLFLVTSGCFVFPPGGMNRVKTPIKQPSAKESSATRSRGSASRVQ